ncbi:MAG: RagB/SusD family nutrient uptake outer membrane protein [Bacteroidetes bacterium]|uniref:RagB/SusD family nutrient uptake outer membrane protein n=1 Tax=Candidatus Cryptobacteroides intestinavium TaxID=2840766 RepID=A0A9D9HHP4_9BACT|nr:RagB/SusD family nutrient uptake outer membrane protein [Candidatus Cryptobacteroides intestinavium]
MKTHGYISAAAGIALAFTSCSLMGPLDDLKIDYVYTDETVIQDAASAENALAGIYASWKSFGNCAFFTNQALRAGTISYANIIGYDEFQINQLTDENASVKQFYTGQYFIINGANSFIEALCDGRQITGLSDERKEEMLSEAYFLKALSEHYLLCTFGQFYDQTSEYGIVIPDGPVRESITKARSTVADSYDVILSDLDKAVNAPEYPAVGHAGRYAVMLLRAKVLLNAGRYQDAALTAGNLIQAKDADLAGSFLEPFAAPYESSEILFDLYCTYPESTLGSDSYSYYYSSPGDVLTDLADSIDGVPGDGATSSVSNEDVAAWLAEGTNEQDIIAYINEMNMGFTSYTSFQDIVDEYVSYGFSEAEAYEYAIQDIISYAELMGVEFEGSGWTGYDSRYIQTYSNPQGSNGISKYIYTQFVSGPSNTIFLLRLADAYYIKAEAEARQGASRYDAARDALARVIERAGYDRAYVDGIPDEDLVRTIMQHRFMENFTENMDDYYDQVRALMLDGENFCSNDGCVSMANTLIAPVPREALAGNNLLEQLPYRQESSSTFN